MDQKTLLKKLMQESKKGNISEVLHMIRSNNIELQENYALNIVVDCSTKCSKCSVRDVTELLNIAVKSIINPKESYSLAYLQSIFYILKFFISHENYNDIFLIENAITPKFLLKTLPNTHRKVYCAIVNQFIYMISILKFTNKNELIEVIKSTTKIVIRIADTAGIFDLAYAGSFQMNSVNIDTKCQAEYYFYVLELLKSRNQKLNYAQEDCPSFFTLFSYIWCNILKTKNFNNFKSFFETSMTLIKDCQHISKVQKSLECVLNFIPREYKHKNEISLENLKQVLKNYNNIKAQLANVFHCIFYSLVNYYKSNENIWLQFSEKEQISLLENIKSIFELVSELNQCSCTSKSMQNCHENQRFYDYIYSLAKIQMKTAKTSIDYCNKIKDMFKSLYKSAKAMVNVNCKNRQLIWKNLGIHMYNLAVTLYKYGSMECIEYFSVFVRYSLQSNLDDEEKMMTVSLNSICDKLFKQKDYKKCMVMTAFLVLISKDQQARSTAFKAWWLMSKVKLKEISRNEEDQQLTLVSTLEKHKFLTDSIADITKFLTLPKRIELLTLELEIYKTKWFSREPVLAAFKELSFIADLSTTVKVAVDIFGDCQYHVHPNVLKIIVKTLTGYEEQIKCMGNSEKYYLGVLYHLKYKHVVTSVVEKHCDEMEKSLMIIAENIEIDEPPDALPKDQNEECNIISSYDSLKLDKFLVNLKILNKSIEMFEGTNFEKLNDRDLEVLRKLLLKMGLEYRLQKIDTYSFKIFQLFFKVSEIKNNLIDALNCINFLTENNNISRDLQHKLIVQGDNIVNTIERSSENIKIILMFIITKSNIIFYSNYKKSYEIFKEAQILYESQENKDSLVLVKGKLLYMQHKFLNDVPCDLQVENHDKTSFSKLLEAHTILYKAFGTLDPSDVEIITAIFEINEEVVKLHYNLNLPREVRSFSRETALLAQKMLIPLRTVTYLTYLAYADLISCRFEDCKLRLEGIEDILCLRKNIYMPTPKNEVAEQKCAGNVEKITSSVQEMVLDFPTSYKKQFSCSSPTLTIESFKMPSFFSHNESCVCFFCTNVEYHKYLLFKTKIEALYYDYQKNTDIANDFFKGALHLHETLLKFYKNKKIEDSTIEISCEIFLEYGNHLARNLGKTEALKMNLHLLDMLKNKENMYSYVYRQALLQYICLSFTFAPENISTSNNESVDVIESSILSVTPESKHNDIRITLTSNCKISPPKRRLKKPRKFDLSPDESEQKPQPPKLEIFGSNLLPNKVNFANTQLLASIEISEPKTRKKTSKSASSSKENDCKSPESPKNKIQIISGSEVKRKATKSINKQPTIYGTNFVLPSTSKVENKATGALKKRTMSLTECLQKQDVAKNENKKKSVRKNLMNEMGDERSSSSSSSSGVVRRSSRKKT